MPKSRLNLMLMDETISRARRPIRLVTEARWETNRYLTELLAELAQLDVELRGFSLASFLAQFDVVHFHSHQFAWLQRRGLASLTRLIKLLLILTILSVRRKAVFWTVHDTEPYADEMGPLKRAVFAFVHRWFLARCDGFLFHSESARARLAAAGVNLAAKRFVIAEHPLFNHPLPSEAFDAEAARRALGLGSEKVLLLFGDFRANKRPHWFLETFAGFPEFGKVTVLVAGRQHSPLPGCALTDTRVRIYDRFIAESEVAMFFTAADWVVLPYREITTSGAMHSAAAFSKPCLTSDLPYFREKLTDAGTRFEYGNAESLRAALTEALALSSDAAAEVGRGFRARCRENTWKKLAQAQVALYQLGPVPVIDK